MADPKPCGPGRKLGRVVRRRRRLPRRLGHECCGATWGPSKGVRVSVAWAEAGRRREQDTGLKEFLARSLRQEKDARHCRHLSEILGIVLRAV